MKKITNIITVAAVIMIIAFACSESVGGASDPNVGSHDGTGGSMARFTIVGDCIYTVDENKLSVVSIADPAHPMNMNNQKRLGRDIETIFPYDGKLFIGSRSGMLIYDVSDPYNPFRLSETSHITSCDPVVVAGKYAYVTLNADNVVCGRGTNELQIYNIENPTYPKMVYSNRAINCPKGLGVDEAAAKLFVCTKGGVLAYDISNPEQPFFLQSVSSMVGIIDTYDVIPMNGLLMVIGADGLYQFDYTQEEITFISKISLQQSDI